MEKVVVEFDSYFNYYDFHSRVYPIDMIFRCAVCDFSCYKEAEFDNHVVEAHGINKTDTLMLF